MDKNLKDKLRLLKVDLLSILHTLTITESVALDLHEISYSTDTAEGKLKGSISALRRITVENESILLPAGRDSQGRLRWKINEAVVDKHELAIFLENEILGKEGITYKKDNKRP